MKIIKPQRLALLHRVYEHLGQCHLVVAGMLYFPFDQPDYLLPEVALWKFVAKELGKDAMLDACMPKARCEVLVVGRAFAPGAQPVEQMQVRLVLGDPQAPALAKTLLVFGDRAWRRGLAGQSPGPAQPFLEMPLDYAHAFGGSDFPHNPLGKGSVAMPEDAQGRVLHPLPNLESPGARILSPQDRPPPACLAPLDFLWPQRQRHLGTYDKAWLKARFPGFADDMKLAAFNTASEDQQLRVPLAAGESFRVEGMHPQELVLTGRLPLAAVRCFINQNSSQGLRLREVEMSADTLWLFPHARRGVLVFRGVAAIGTDDAEDILHLVAAAESSSQPRPVAHYSEILDLRLDHQKAVLHAANEAPLLPPMPVRTAAFPDDSGGEDHLFVPKGLRRRALGRKARKDLEAAKARVRKLRDQVTERFAEAKAKAPPGTEMNAPELASLEGLLAVEFPEESEAASLEELPALKEHLIAKAKAARERAAVQTAAAEERSRQSLAKLAQPLAQAREKAALAGVAEADLPPAALDFDQLMAQGRKGLGGPPKPFAQRRIEQLRALPGKLDEASARLVAAPPAQAASAEAELARGKDALAQRLPELEAALRDGEAQVQLAYRRHAHLMMPARRMERAASDAARARVLSALATGESLAGADFTGADLSRLELAGVDLSDALLEAVDLSGADLRGANFNGAVLARANLRGARLEGARFQEANLGLAELDAALAAGVDFTGAKLDNASLAGGDFTGACLAQASLLGARLGGANLTQVKAPGAKFLAMDVAQREIPEPGGPMPAQAELDMTGVRFAGADLSKSLFVHCLLAGADFSAANLTGACFLAAKGDGARFARAELTNLRLVSNCSFADADFSGSTLTGANLRGTNLLRGNFDGCLAGDADFSEARLADASFQGVKARGARFAKADLSGARMQGIDLMNGVLQKALLLGTRLRRANLFGADLLRIRTDEGTDLSGANLGRTLLAGEKST